MVNTRDVNLLIKARDQASKEIAEVANAFRGLLGTQDELKNSAAKTGSLLDRLGQEFSDLNKQVAGLATLGKAVAQMERAAEGVGRLDAAVQKAKGRASELVAEYSKFAVASRTLKESADRARAAQDEQTNSVKRAKDALAELRSPAARSFAVFDPTAFNQEKNARKAALEQEKASLKEAARARKEADAALVTSQARQEALKAAYIENAAALRKNKTELSGLKSELAGANGLAQAAAAAFGGVALNQDAIAKEAARAAESLDRVSRVLEKQRAISAAPSARLSGAAAATAQYREQVQAVRDAQTAWKSAQADANKLAASMRGVAKPTAEMQQAFLLAQATSKQARSEYIAQADALNKLRGAVSGSYADFDRRAAALSSQVAAQNRFSQTSTSTANSQFKLRDALRGVAAAMQSGATATNANSEALRRNGAASRQALSFAQRIRSEVLSLTTTYIGLYAAIREVGSVVQAFQTVEAATSRLNVVFNGDTGRVAEEIRWLREEAIRLGVSFEVLGDTYSKFAVAAQTANFTSDATRYIFTSVAEAARVNKTSVENLKGVFLALEQMISKGKVSSEELRRQLGDRMAGAFSLFAAGLKMTTQELDAALRAGEVFSTQTTLVDFADELQRKFGKQLPTALESLTVQMGRLQALFFDFKVQIAEAGFAEELRRAITELNAALKSNDGQAAIQAISNALSGLVRAVAFVVRNFDTLATVLQVFVNYKLAQVILGAAGAFGNLSTAAAGFVRQLAVVARFSRITFTQMAAQTGAARVGMLSLAGATTVLATGLRTLRALLAGLGGIGLAFAAASVATEVAMGWASSIDNATAAMERHEQIVNKVRTAYANADGKVADLKKNLKDLTEIEVLNAIQDEYRVLQEAFAGVFVARDNPIFKDLRKGIGTLREVAKAFKDGKISGDEFRKAVSDIAKAEPAFGRDYIQGLIDSSRAAEQSRARLEDYLSVLKAVQGRADETTESQLQLKKAAEETAKIDTSNFQKYSEALNEIKGLVPELANEMKRLKDIAKLDELAAEIYKLGPPTKQVLDLINQARQAINDEALNNTVRGSLVDRIIAVESGGNANATNSRSTATGLGQFIESTWLRLFKQYFPDRAASMTDAMILAQRRNESDSRALLGAYLEENAKALRAAGKDVNGATLYLAHFLGAGGATRVLGADPNTPLDRLLDRRAIEANPNELGGGRTAADLIEWARIKAGLSERELEIAESIRKSEDARAETAAKFADDYAKRNAELEFNAQASSMAERDAYIEKGIRELRAEAMEKEIELTDAMISKRRELLASEYDAANAERLRGEEQRRVEESVNQLVERRRLLMEQIEYFQGQGNVGMVQQLQTELATTDTSLQTAIANAIKFWEAIGGPEAQNKILALKSLNNQLAQVNTLTKISAQEINDNFVSGASGAFDRFAEAVANGQNALSALRDSFLQFAADFLRQIAQMIIQQALFNALGGGPNGSATGGIGGFVSKIAGFLFHSGGVVGTAGQSRSVAPSWFQNAVRYHQGGIAGLKPGEVPAILEKGEEVLTQSDPRHVGNLGGAASPAGVTVVNAFDASDMLSQALNTPVGEQVFLNFVQSNSQRVRGAIGV